MKRVFVLLFTVLLFVPTINGQNNDALIQSIRSKIKRSDKAIQNPKKSQKLSTWDKRGRIFLDAYEVNIKYLAPGIAAATIPFLGLTENNTVPYYGKPKKRYKDDDGREVWEYDKVKIYVKNGVVDSWEITKPVVEDALIKAYQAFTKAMELDTKDKYKHKKSTIKRIAKLREYLKNEAINYYFAKNYKKALQYLEASIDLFKYPRAKEDTTANIGAYYYYAGIFAYSAGDKEKAKKYLKAAIDNNYEIGTCYQYLAQVYYEEGDSTTAVKLLEEGAQKYPQEVKIIYSLIDYYSPRGMTDKALEYLDKALKLSPDLAVLYFVKGDAYAKIYLNLQKEYFKNLKIADSLRKAAFRARNNEKVSDSLKQVQKKYEQKAQKLKTQMDKYYALVEEWYKKGFEKNPNYTNAYLMLADFYIKVANANYAYGQPQRKQEIYDKYMGIYKDNLQKAVSQYEKYDKIKPNDPDVLNQMRIIYYKLKQYDKANAIKARIEKLKTKTQSENQK